MLNISFPKESISLIFAAFAALATSTSWALPTGTPAGQIEFTVGDAVAIHQGEKRSLKKGDPIYVGDLINTQSGRSQIRFSDGGFISLQPDTHFRVDEYSYSGKTDGSEKSIFSFLRGAMRAVTGAIGKVNRDNYEVKTNTATIGIRGTGFTGQTNGTALVAGVFDGSIYLRNGAGELQLYKGQSAIVDDAKTPPRLSFERPSLRPSPSRNAIRHGSNQQESDDRNNSTNRIDSRVSATNGIPLSLLKDIATYLGIDPSTLGGQSIAQLGSTVANGGSVIDSLGRDVSAGTTISGQRLVMVQMYNGLRTQTSGSTTSTVNTNSNDAYFAGDWTEYFSNGWNFRSNFTTKYSNSSGHPTEFQADGAVRGPGPYTLNKGTTQRISAGSDALVAWGKWANGETFFTCEGCHVQTVLSGNAGNAYVVGDPTTTLPLGKATYSLLGATQTSSNSNNAAWSSGQVTGGSLVANFDSMRMDVHLKLLFPNMGSVGNQARFNIDALGVTIGNDGRVYAVGNYTTGTGGATACTSGSCSTRLDGFFIGNGNSATAGLESYAYVNGKAGRFGLGYIFSPDGSANACGSYMGGCSNTYVGGTAAYTLADSGPGVTGLTAVALDSTSTSGPGGATNATAYFSAANANKLVSVDAAGASYSIGTASAQSGASGELSWNRWYGGIVSGSTGNRDVSANNAAIHQIAGIPTPSMPTGSATYTLISGGYTTPSASSSGSEFGNGSITSGALTANFDTHNLTANLAVHFPNMDGGTTYTVNAPATISGNQFAGSNATAATASKAAGACAACQVNIAGFFAGTSASKAGLGYEVIRTDSVRIQGTAAFQKAPSP